MKHFRWEITHLKGYEQVGPAADRQSDNLVAATKEANTEMMFFDAAITGNTDIVVQTVAEVYAARIEITDTLDVAHILAEMSQGPST